MDMVNDQTTFGFRNKSTNPSPAWQRFNSPKDLPKKRVNIFPMDDNFKLPGANNLGSKLKPFSPQPTRPSKIKASSKRIKIDQIENILLGKSGTEDINLSDFRKLSFYADGSNPDQNNNKNRIWSRMLDYTKGKQKDGKFNHYILFQKIRRELINAIKLTKPHHAIFLENYNIYKSYMLQKFVFPVLHHKKSKEDEKRIKILLQLICDKSFHESLRVKFLPEVGEDKK